MNLIFKGLCPICHTLIKDDDSDDLIFCDYFYCPRMCYQLYENSRQTMVMLNVSDYIIKYNMEQGNTITEVINSDGQRLLYLHSQLKINWKDLEATVNKIKSLIVFS